MRPFARLLSASAVGLMLLIPAVAEAKVYITVDLATQTMHVDAQNQTFDWKVSTGKPGYETPTGTSGVLWMDKDHHSDEYDGAYMPNAIFFKPGVAIHGFGRSPWGHAASHGCVRLPVAKSAVLWDLVKAEGGAEVTVVGHTPETTVAERASRHRDPAYDEAQGDAQTARGYETRAYDQRTYDQRSYDPRYGYQRTDVDPNETARGDSGYPDPRAAAAAPQPNRTGLNALFGSVF